jgi:hypothetical protein
MVVYGAPLAHGCLTQSTSLPVRWKKKAFVLAVHFADPAVLISTTSIFLSDPRRCADRRQLKTEETIVPLVTSKQWHTSQHGPSSTSHPALLMDTRQW